MQNNSYTGSTSPSPGYSSLNTVPEGSSQNQPFGGHVTGNIASAPPLDHMETVPGYNPELLRGEELLPPSYEESVMCRTPAERQPQINLPTISEEEAREYLLEEVSRHCCYGKTAAQELSIAGLVPNSAFHYVLDSFTESRMTNWAVEPYQGQPIDGPHYGPPPTPWQVQIYPQQNFKDSTASIEVPHTATVKPCHICAGTGRRICRQCNGTSRERCSKCQGQGHICRQNESQQSLLEPCQTCHGTGHKLCALCHGSGSMVCSTCAGRAQLKCYIKLTVTWKVHTDEDIFMETGLPEKLIKKARGTVAFEEEAALVHPITNFVEAAINRTSQSLVNAHRSRWPNERILLQRQMVHIIPITEVHYSWKNKHSSYFVYGSDHAVYAPRYPQRCCWMCNIL